MGNAVNANAKGKVGERLNSYNCQAHCNAFCAWGVCSMQVAMEISKWDKRELTTAWKCWCMRKGKSTYFPLFRPFYTEPPFSPLLLSLTSFVYSVMWLWEQQQPDKRYIRARPILRYPSSGFKNPLQIYVPTYNFKDKVFFHLLLSHFYTQNQAIADRARTELWTLWPSHVRSIQLRKDSIPFFGNFQWS